MDKLEIQAPYRTAGRQISPIEELLLVVKKIEAVAINANHYHWPNGILNPIGNFLDKNGYKTIYCCSLREYVPRAVHQESKKFKELEESFRDRNYICYQKDERLIISSVGYTGYYLDGTAPLAKKPSDAFRDTNCHYPSLVLDLGAIVVISEGKRKIEEVKLFKRNKNKNFSNAFKLKQFEERKEFFQRFYSWDKEPIWLHKTDQIKARISEEFTQVLSAYINN